MYCGMGGRGLGFIELAAAPILGPFAPLALIGELAFTGMFAPIPDYWTPAFTDVEPPALRTQADADGAASAMYHEGGDLVFTARGGVYQNNMGMIPSWEQALQKLIALGVKLLAYHNGQYTKVNYPVAVASTPVANNSMSIESLSTSILPLAAIGLVIYAVIR